MTRLRVAWCLVLLLQLGLQPCELRRASAKEAAVGKSKTARSKSADTARLKSEHPADPVKWFDQVNVHFKAGDKAKAADLLHDASRHFPNQPDMAFNHAYGGHVASLFFSFAEAIALLRWPPQDYRPDKPCTYSECHG